MSITLALLNDTHDTDRVALDSGFRLSDEMLVEIDKLVDKRISRADCYRWMEQQGYPRPLKSSCYFCPYHSQESWRELKVHSPDDFERAVKIDKLIRKGVRGFDDELYLHASRVPLAEVDFSLPAHNQPDLFGNECEGMCGV